MPSSMTVSALHVHPVKSCRRVEVDRATVGPYGLVGDREWQVAGLDGHRLTQRTHPRLALVQPTFLEAGLRLSAPDVGVLEVARPTVADVGVTVFLGTVRLGDAGDEAARWFEGVLGEPCRLQAMTAEYERRLPEHVDIFGQEVALGDAAPVLVVCESSHRFLADRASQPFGIDRFRPNVIVAGSKPWEEDTWVSFTVGRATMRTGLPWPRCTVPQVDQDTGRRGREPAVVLKANRWCSDAPMVVPRFAEVLRGSALFGIGCAAGPAGTVIAVGDDVTVLETAEPLIPAPLEARTSTRQVARHRQTPDSRS